MGATETYQQVIGMIEGEGHLTTSRMSRAVAGVANAYYEAKRYDLAADAYDRALQLNRRNEGLFNEEQLPLLDRRADSLTSLGRYEEALQALAYGMRVAERRYGAEDQRTIDRLEQLGRWYTRVGAYEASRQALRNAVRLVEKRSGPNAIELVGPLLAIGESYREQLLDPEAMRESAEDDRNSVFHDSNASTGMPSRTPGLLAAEGERALERAVEIVDRQPQPSPVQVVDVRTQLGDWYQTRLQHDRALPQYQLAWAAAGQTPPLDGKSLREMLFGQPILLHYTPATDWKRYARRPADEVVARTVEIDLTVSAEGRVTRTQARIERRRRAHGRGGTGGGRHRALPAALRRRQAGRDAGCAPHADVLRADREARRVLTTPRRQRRPRNRNGLRSSRERHRRAECPVLLAAPEVALTRAPAATAAAPARVAGVVCPAGAGTVSPAGTGTLFPAGVGTLSPAAAGVPDAGAEPLPAGGTTGVSGALAGSSPRTIACSRNSAASLAAASRIASPVAALSALVPLSPIVDDSTLP